MCADYTKVANITRTVFERVKDSRTVRVTGPGTNLTAKLDYNHSEITWVIADGKIQKQGTWNNLPDGEVFTTPLSVNGTITTYVLGDYFDKKYGVLKTPVKFEFENGYVKAISSEDKALETELYQYANAGENTNRVGEFAIGTNYAVTHFVGRMLADEKAIGDSIGGDTGAKWSANQHCDLVVQGVTIIVDDVLLMENGTFRFN